MNKKYPRGLRWYDYVLEALFRVLALVVFAVLVLEITLRTIAFTALGN